MVAICLLGALVYEVHNAPGRYVKHPAYPTALLDTSTGKIWKYHKHSDKWSLVAPAIPNRSHSVD